MTQGSCGPTSTSGVMQVIEKAVKVAVRKQLAVEYPHLELPAAMLAEVTQLQLTGDVYEYNLKILGKDGIPDTRFPEVPGVKSRVNVLVGSTVAVLLLYGDLNPIIVCEVV